MLASTPLPVPLLIVNADQPDNAGRARQDLQEGFAAWRLALTLARLDLRNRYRGSVLGPFWFTLSSAVMVAGLGLLYSQLLNLDLAGYLLHLAVSLIVWQIISGLANDAVSCMTSVEGVIRQIRLPYTTHALRCTIRNALTGLHQVPLILILFVALGHNPGWAGLLVIPGIAILAINGFAASLLLGMVCARFRDIGQIIGNVLQLAFFLTPIMWKPEMLTPEARVWLPLNPFYSILETLRGPLVEGGGPGLAWVAAIGFTVVNCVVAFVFFTRFRSRIAFWV